jgi:hypothetical protein
MNIPGELERWSWVAGVVGGLAGLVVISGLAWNAMKSTIYWSIHRGDWVALDRVFGGVRIGASVASLQKINKRPIDRAGEGAIKTTKWRLDSGNEMSVTYDSEQDKILFMEIDWNHEASGINLGVNGLKFGTSTLRQIRRRYGNNGFSYANFFMRPIADGFVTVNAFELKATPKTVVVFITKLCGDSVRRVSELPEQKQLALMAEFFKLDAIIVADEAYLDEIWGSEKAYDPGGVPISV